jgi:hypothetical protein
VLPRPAAIAACVLVLAASSGVAACGADKSEQGVKEPASEGLALNLEGLKYNVFLTRQLNPKIQEDAAYIKQDAPPGSSLYGIFVQVCNQGKTAKTPTDNFVVKDNQGHRFVPQAMSPGNDFAYVPRTLLPHECIPDAGSVAQLGPTAGSMLLFQFPLQNTENRPLELEIEGTGGHTLTYTLDI